MISDFMVERSVDVFSDDLMMSPLGYKCERFRCNHKETHHEGGEKGNNVRN